MSIGLNFEAVKGLRLRQQLATEVERVDGHVTAGKTWHFEKEQPGIHNSPDLEVSVDRDPRTKEPGNTYSNVTVSFGLKNLVIDKPEGPAIQVPFRNSSIRNQLRVKLQTLASTGKKTKSGAEIKEWRDSGSSFLAPQTWGGVVIGDGTRAILEEMPT